MINPRQITLLMVVLALWSSVSSSQIGRLNSKAILVRSPDTDNKCTKGDQTEAVSVGNDSVTILRGDRFQIITHRNGILNAEVIDTCKASTYFENGLFLLRANEYVGWEGEYDALLAVKGDSIQSDQIGSVARVRLNQIYRASACEALKGQIPPTDTIIAESGPLLIPPKSSRLYLFVPTEHYDIKDYRGNGEKAIASLGLLFEIRDEGLTLLISEKDLENIYSISDIDSDGIWEMLVLSGNWGGGTYDLRFFDGTRFTTDKLELYDWSH